MDLTRAPPKEPGHKVSVSVTTALVSAFLEWTLMFMIFIDAILAYLITSFARYCQLRTPCLLCSRLDRVLGTDHFRGDLICSKHKFEISSLVLCQLHNSNSIGAPVAVEDPHLLPHVEYTKIKVTSDSDSESSFTPFVESSLSEGGRNNDSVSEPSELVSFSEAAARSPDINGTAQYDESKGTNATNASESEKEAHVECLEASNPSESPKNKVNKEREENEIQIDPKPNSSSQISEPFDLGDAYKLAVSSTRVSSSSRQLSGKFLEQQKSMAESTRASEDLKLLLSQLSAARSIELLSLRDNTSPRISLERNESNLSLDGSVISEIEGESSVDRLKRQVEHDKKLISGLYKELEEEINASSIAANQAMAMITRLQEEKASLHMEALQCLRMMEEQAEYDDEALRRANDLIAEKDKQIQDLEYELESIRR